LGEHERGDNGGNQESGAAVPTAGIVNQRGVSMSALFSDARNIRHSVVEDDDGKKSILTTIEAVISLMTRKMVFSGTGISKTEDLETVRFEMTISAAKKFVEHIESWIETAEEEQDMLILKP
jgi:hypothetical protein